jgi:hypothetical protein
MVFNQISKAVSGISECAGFLIDLALPDMNVLQTFFGFPNRAGQS